MELKTYQLKSPEFVDDEGYVKARFSTLEVVDLDGDWTAKGAIGRQDVRISAFGHGSWRGELPVGKGIIYEEHNTAILEGRFFLSTTTGREHYHTVKEMGELMQWSYGLVDIQSDRKHINGKEVRVITSVRVPEVSPVLLGSGIETATLDIKAHEQKQDGFEIQSLLFPTARWTRSGAQQWLRDHDFAIELDETEEHFRARQADPADFSRLRTICLVPGRDTPMDECRVKAVGGPPKGLEPEGFKLDDDMDDLFTRFDLVLDRVEAVKAIRDSQGRRLSAGRVEQLTTLQARLSRLLPAGPAPDELRQNAALMQQLEAAMRRL